MPRWLPSLETLQVRLRALLLGLQNCECQRVEVTSPDPCWVAILASTPVG
jgi:hypothetical protein